MPSRPKPSCHFTMSRIAASSALRSSAFEILPTASWSRASSNSFGRRKLPTWSARNGGLSRFAMAVPDAPLDGLHFLDLVELDVPKLAVLHLAAADVDVLHDVARLGVDRDASARARPGLALGGFH